MRRLAILLGLLLAPGALARDQPLQWQTRQSADGFILAYEQPDSDNQPISFACEPPSAAVQVMVVPPHRAVRAGSRINVEFASEGGRARMTMLAERSELDDGVMLRGTVRLREGLGEVLARGGQLRLSFGRRSQTFPLAGSAEGVAALRRACGG